jgi:hypothetical protein
MKKNKKEESKIASLKNSSVKKIKLILLLKKDLLSKNQINFQKMQMNLSI